MYIRTNVFLNYVANYVEYLVVWYSDDWSTQPALNLEGWLKVTRGVSRSWVIEFGHSFNPLMARSSLASS